MIDKETLDHVIVRLGPVAAADIAWAERLGPPVTSVKFALEAIYVICNSGMKNTVARNIYFKIMDALHDGKSAGTVFGHKGKVSAIDTIWADRNELLIAYLAAGDKLEFLEGLPWIGPVTKYHLAKNFGVDVAKPDVHLQRLADLEGTTAQALCERLASECKYRIATIDTLLWRACANGIINSKTGLLT